MTQPDRAPFRGIYPILQTPFREDDTIDAAALRQELEFVIAAGTHGMCWPQAGSEFWLLTDAERYQIAELIVRTVDGRLPVILGVQSTNHWRTALDFARHAELIGADGIISLPPFQATPNPEQAVDYFSTLSKATSLPVFVQNTAGQYGPALSVDAMIDLARACPTVVYVKDEVQPSLERIRELALKGAGLMEGIFTGSGANYLMDEMRAGAQGCCPGADLVDVHSRVYDLYQAGQEAEAQALFDGLAPMRGLQLDAHWMLLMKERLRRRGVLPSTRSRVAPYELRWKSDEDRAAFDAAYAAIEPLFSL
jgi:dihydrodipicolinate synthase/N-acetylneuraminate lyase